MFHCIIDFVINLDEFRIRSLLRFRLYENSMLGSGEQLQDDSSVSVSELFTESMYSVFCTSVV